MEEKRYLKLEIPGLPTRPNENNFKHRWVKYREGKKWHEIVGSAFMATGCDIRFAAQVRIVYTRYSTRYCDWDAIPASLKAVQDALVRCGILVDDSAKYIPRCPEYRQEKCKKNETKIVIEIWEL
jgi:Holliday junction resolvase RusA-like endonuclease